MLGLNVSTPTTQSISSDGLNRIRQFFENRFLDSIQTFTYVLEREKNRVKAKPVAKEVVTARTVAGVLYCVSNGQWISLALGKQRLLQDKKGILEVYIEEDKKVRDDDKREVACIEVSEGEVRVLTEAGIANKVYSNQFVELGSISFMVKLFPPHLLHLTGISTVRGRKSDEN